MASHIKRGESIFIPFRNGQSIWDSQLKPRMYKSKKAFLRSFPGYYLDGNSDSDVALSEYAEVVRCKDCKYYREGKHFPGTNFCFRLKGSNGENVGYNFSDDDFCSRGERKDND